MTAQNGFLHGIGTITVPASFSSGWINFRARNPAGTKIRLMILRSDNTWYVIQGLTAFGEASTDAAPPANGLVDLTPLGLGVTQAGVPIDGNTGTWYLYAACDASMICSDSSGSPEDYNDPAYLNFKIEFDFSATTAGSINSESQYYYTETLQSVRVKFNLEKNVLLPQLDVITVYPIEMTDSDGNVAEVLVDSAGPSEPLATYAKALPQINISSRGIHYDSEVQGTNSSYAPAPCAEVLSSGYEWDASGDLHGPLTNDALFSIAGEGRFVNLADCGDLVEGDCDNLVYDQNEPLTGTDLQQEEQNPACTVLAEDTTSLPTKFGPTPFTKYSPYYIPTPPCASTTTTTSTTSTSSSSTSTTTPPPAIPVATAAISCGAAGSVSGLANPNNQCCNPVSPFFPAPGWGNYASEAGTSGSTLSGTITIEITDASPDGPCDGIDGSDFPECAYIILGVDDAGTPTALLYYFIQTANGYYYADYSINGTTWEVTLSVS